MRFIVGVEDNTPLPIVCSKYTYSGHWKSQVINVGLSGSPQDHPVHLDRPTYKVNDE